VRTTLCLSLLLLLAGCKTALEGSIVKLTITSATPLTVARLHLVVMAARRSESFDVALGAIPPARSVALTFDPSVTGIVAIHADAFDPAGRLLGSGDASDTLHSGSTLALAISFGEPGVDMGASDLSGTQQLAADLANAAQGGADLWGADLACGGSTHACNGQCVANTSTASCGSSCTACVAPSGGNATCDGKECGGSCPMGKQLCFSSCIDVKQACNGMCPSGQHACSGLCEDVTSVNACGNSCAPCAAPSGNGHATCDGVKCGLSCDNNFKTCNGDCIPTTQCCSDTDCPNPPSNGRGICGGDRQCHLSCNTGYVPSATICDVAPAQQMSPLSTQHTTTQMPTLRWKLAAGTTAARVEVCATRACTSILRTSDTASGAYKVTPALSAGTYFWRVHGKIGGTTGTITSPVWQFVVGARDSAFDSAWGAVLDLNGDGLAESAMGGDYTSYVYNGGSNPPAARSAVTGWGPYVIGDVNGDGFADLAESDTLKVKIYFGGPNGVTNAGSPLVLDGNVIPHEAGDANGDGYGDVLFADFYNGVVTLHLGGPNGPSNTAAQTWKNPDTANVRNWSYIVSTADFNGDGNSDLFIGGSEASWIYYGSASGWPATPSQRFDDGFRSFGGDVNGDGYCDMLALSYQVSPQQVMIYGGGPSGLSLYATVTLASGKFFGDVLGGGDLDGDGFSDFALPSDALVVYRGTNGTFGSPVAIPWPPNSSNTVKSLKLNGDVNGDNLDDLLLGDSSFNSTQGIAYIFVGDAKALVATTPTFTFNAPSTNSYFGFPLAL
jgi:hypothetical protein